MDKLHNITVGLDGTFKPQGKFGTNSNIVDVNTVVNTIKQTQKQRLAIYIHGGLVNYENGVASAEGINAVMEGPDVYPLSLVWKSGFGETIRDNILDIRKTRLFKKVLKFVIKKAGAKLGGDIGTKGAARITDAEIEKELEKDYPFADFKVSEGARSAIDTSETGLSRMEEELYVELEEDIEMDAEFKEILRNIDVDKDFVDPSLLDQTWENEEGRKGIFSLGKIIRAIVKIAIRVIRRFINGRDHQPYATIMEEILREIYIADFGAWVWGGMKNKAEQMWLPNEGLSGKDLHVGTYLMKQLNEAYAGQTKEIDLLGHSAGAVVICNLMKDFTERYTHLKIRKIIFLAPACRADLFHSEVVLHPERYESFRMFTMNDKAELADALVNQIPKLYPSSLLYFVSGLLERLEDGESTGFDEPILGMERFIARDFYQDIYPYLTEVKAFLMQEGRLVLSPVTGQPDGFNSESIDHGYFDNDPTTKESINFIINEDLA